MAATILFVANFPANTGYAWDFIEGLFAGVATRLAPFGARTLVAYPEIASPPRPGWLPARNVPVVRNRVAGNLFDAQ